MVETGAQPSREETAKASVPQGFEFLYGNSPVQDAEVVLIGEIHDKSNWSKIGEAIRQIAKPHDFLLFEGVPFLGMSDGQKQTIIERYGIDDIADTLYLEGWEHQEAYLKRHKGAQELRTLATTYKSRTSLAAIVKNLIHHKKWKKMNDALWHQIEENRQYRDEASQESNAELRYNIFRLHRTGDIGRGRKAIVIAGRSHVRDEKVKAEMLRYRTVAMQVKGKRMSTRAAYR